MEFVCLGALETGFLAQFHGRFIHSFCNDTFKYDPSKFAPSSFNPNQLLRYMKKISYQEEISNDCRYLPQLGVFLSNGSM